MFFQITLAVIAIVLLMLVILRQRIVAGRLQVNLRPLPGYRSLKKQVGHAIEGSSALHISLGQGSLVGQASATSIAATKILDALAQDGCANGTPPLVTVGEGTLLPMAQAQLRAAFEEAGRTEQFDPNQAIFVAAETDQMAYAGGVASEIHLHKVAGNIVAGQFGPEIAIIAEAASRNQVEQVIGSNNPVALAVATAVTDNVLIGEELLASGAYLEGTPSQLASVQLQDILRWFIILAMIIFAVFEMFV